MYLLTFTQISSQTKEGDLIHSIDGGATFVNWADFTKVRLYISEPADPLTTNYSLTGFMVYSQQSPIQVLTRPYQGRAGTTLQSVT